MTVLASDIITRVRNQLIDTNTDLRWTDAELLSFLSDAQRAVVAAIPTSCTTTTNHQLTAGTRQQIPSDGYIALTVHRNVGGRAVTMVPRQLFDTQYPDWHNETPTQVIRHFFIEPTDPKAFYCYPPSDGLGVVVITYSALPQELSATTDELAVDDIYATPVFDYTMYRCHQKDNDFAAGNAVSNSYLSAFAAFCTAQQAGENA